MQLAFRSIDGSTPFPPLALSGLPTSIATLPGGAFAVGVDLGSGRAAEIDVFSPGAHGFDSAAKLSALQGLKVGPMSADPMGGRVYVGFEPAGGVSDQGNALVGLLEYHPSTPSMSRLVPALIKTADPALTALEYDSFDDELVAVSSTRNRITQIMLLR
jgi:hypothetical protein